MSFLSSVPFCMANAIPGQAISFSSLTFMDQSHTVYNILYASLFTVPLVHLFERNLRKEH